MPDNMSKAKPSDETEAMSYFVEACNFTCTEFVEGDDKGLLAFIKQHTKTNRPIRVFYEPALKTRSNSNSLLNNCFEGTSK